MLGLWCGCEGRCCYWILWKWYILFRWNFYVNIDPKVIGGHIKIFRKYTWNFSGKTWKYHGNIMEFCQSGNVGTLLKDIPRDQRLSGHSFSWLFRLLRLAEDLLGNLGWFLQIKFWKLSFQNQADGWWKNDHDIITLILVCLDSMSFLNTIRLVTISYPQEYHNAIVQIKTKKKNRNIIVQNKDGYICCFSLKEELCHWLGRESLSGRIPGFWHLSLVDISGFPRWLIGWGTHAVEFLRTI